MCFEKGKLQHHLVVYNSLGGRDRKIETNWIIVINRLSMASSGQD